MRGVVSKEGFQGGHRQEKQILPGNQIPRRHCLRLSTKKTTLRFSEKEKPFVSQEAAFEFAEKAPVAELHMIEN